MHERPRTHLTLRHWLTADRSRELTGIFTKVNTPNRAGPDSLNMGNQIRIIDLLPHSYIDSPGKAQIVNMGVSLTNKTR